MRKSQANTDPAGYPFAISAGRSSVDPLQREMASTLQRPFHSTDNRPRPASSLQQQQSTPAASTTNRLGPARFEHARQHQAGSNRRSSIHAARPSNRGGSTPERSRFLPSSLRGGETGRATSSYCRSQTPQQAVNIRAFSNGIHQDLTLTPTTKRLDGPSRSQVSLSSCPDSSGTSAVLGFFPSRQALSIPVLAIRSQLRAARVHQVTQAYFFVAHLRSQGVRLVIYLDYLLVIGDTESHLQQHLKMTMDLLESLGFLLNEKKSELTPCRRIRFLGFEVDSNKMTLRLPKEKLRDIRKAVVQARSHPTMPLRHLASLIGKIGAASLALLPGRLQHRFLLRDKNHALQRGLTYTDLVTLSRLGGFTTWRNGMDGLLFQHPFSGR